MKNNCVKAQKEWNTYATTTRVQVDKNILELKRLLGEKLTNKIEEVIGY